jgi:hypothetical protein
MWVWWVVVPVMPLLIAAALVLVRRWRTRRTMAQFQFARQLFHWRREWLEADFLKSAGQNGMPRGLAWADCDFADEVVFATDRVTGQLRAFVAVTIRFAAVAGGGLEDNVNMGNLRAATAVFHFDGHQWHTEGRAIFNLNPLETVQHFQHELQRVE